jgi:uncharacterized protein (DUF433 family)
VSEHIEKRGGVYYVPGTSISLDSIVYAFREGSSPESIREDFEGLTLPHVYGVISFYLDHQAKVDTYLVRRKEYWAEMERKGTPPGADLQTRLEGGSLPRQ